MKQILVLDNFIHLPQPFEYFFKINHYEFRSTFSERAFYRQLERYTPALIIIQKNLVAADGGAICLQLKSVNYYSSVPVLLSSADENIAETYQQYKADGFLNIPYNDDTLLKIISYLL